MRKFILSATIFMILALLIVVGRVNAGEISLPETMINPEIFLYPIKRLQENILLKFTPTGGLYIFHSKLLKTRLAELKHVAEKRFLSHIEKSSQRFAYQTGILSDFIIEKKLTQEKEEQLEYFEQYKKIIASLRDLYQSNSSYWILLQQDIDTLDLNVEKLKK